MTTTMATDAEPEAAKRLRFDGLVWLMLSSVMFVMLGSVFERVSPDSMADFGSVYYGSRCLLQHSDPYQESDLLRTFQADHKEYASAPDPLRRVVMFCVNLPTLLAFVIPFALLPWGPAHLLWMFLTAASFILAAYLMWNLAATNAPVISGALIGLFLLGSEMLLEIGNPAGIEVSLCVIAVWCFLRDRFVPAGILCLALSVAAKPHVAGLVWLYFILAGGPYRKRAWQTLAVAAVLSLPAAIWVSHVAPHWMAELQANLQTASTHGSVDDPGPAGVNSQSHGAIEISLQTVFSIFRDDPRFYNPLTYLLCGPILLVWALTSLRRRFSQDRARLALAAIAALSMLPIYHRLHDTSLLLLAFPAFAMLWAKGGPNSWLALLFTGAGAVLSSDIPVQQLAIHSAHLRESTPGLAGQLLTLALARPVPLVLLVIGIFYLWVYVRHPVLDTREGKARKIAQHCDS
ncbi:MAG: glycosyltransferase family 87 protein [Terracidiphilus sp.]